MWECICSLSWIDTFSSVIKARLRKHVAFDWRGRSLWLEINKSLSSCPVCSASDSKGLCLKTFYQKGSFIPQKPKPKKSFFPPLFSEQDSLSVMNKVPTVRCPFLTPWKCLSESRFCRFTWLSTFILLLPERNVNYNKPTDFPSDLTCHIPLQ